MPTTARLDDPPVEIHESVEITKVRDEALQLWRGDEASASRFLDRPHPLLGGREPLAVARESPAGAERVIKLIGAARAGVAV